MHKRYLTAVVLSALLLGGSAAQSRGAETNGDLGPTTQIATRAEDVPFINGGLTIPSWKQTNNRGVILQQTVPGVTHVEAYLFWRYLEPEQDQWDFREFDEMLALCRERRLRMLILPWVMYTPAWFRQTADYVPLVNMQTGKAVDHLSPWAPGTLAAYDHFYAGMARRYLDRIAIIKLGYPGSVFGEVGLSIGGSSFLPGGSLYEKLPQDPAAWTAGYWCGDRFARADFREQMLQKYGTLARLNAAWGTAFAADAALEFPDPARRGAERVRWLDFVTWLQDSQTRNLVKILRVVRKHFPSTMLDIPLGFGSDMPSDGCDRTGICRAAAEFKPVTIRSTHASFNREGFPRAYWFYKRMAPVAHRYGAGFGTEPPGGDVKTRELLRQYFEDASAGANYIFHYFQNYHVCPDVVGDYKRILRPQEQSLVDIGVLYPTTQMILDMSHAPAGQLQFCAEGRDCFDYDLVDENMIGWDWLKSYKVLLHTSGQVFRSATLPALGKWLEAGGILVTHGAPRWEDELGRQEIAAGWLAHEDTAAARPGVRVYRVGRGRIYAAEAADKIPAYLAKVVGVLNALPPLHGCDGKADGIYTTDFPDGQLRFNTTTLETTFVGNGKTRQDP